MCQLYLTQQLVSFIYMHHLYLSVILFTGGTPPGGNLPDRHPPGRHPQADTPRQTRPPRQTPPRQTCPPPMGRQPPGQTPTWADTHSPPTPAGAAGGTHNTGMHSCNTAVKVTIKVQIFLILHFSFIFISQLNNQTRLIDSMLYSESKNCSGTCRQVDIFNHTLLLLVEIS